MVFCHRAVIAKTSLLCLGVFLLVGSFLGEARAQSQSRYRPQSRRYVVKEVRDTHGSMEAILKQELDGGISGKRIQLKGSFGIAGESIETTDSDSTGASLKARFEGDYRFTESLSSHVELNLGFRASRTQEGVGDSALENGIRLKHGTVNWQPLQSFKVSVGAIRQGYTVGSNLLVDSDENFPGAWERFSFGNEFIELELSAEQAIPTSRSLDSERQDKEKMPSFYLEKVAVNITPNSHFQFKPYFGTYRFNKLPAKVASVGLIQGNSVQECLEADCRFIFEYRGILFGAQSMLRFNDDFNVVGFYNEVKNDAAPNSFNTGRELGALANLRWKKIIFTPEHKLFFNESDSSPAFYNSVEMGGNNVEGQASGLEVAFLDYKFKIAVGYYNSKVINLGSNQKDKEYLYVGLETLNVEF